MKKINLKTLIFVATLVVISLTQLNIARSEPFIAGGVGFTFAPKLNNLTGNENTNYPDAPNPLVGPLLSGAKISPLKLDSSAQVNLKVGYYLDNYSMFGFDTELSYLRPNFLRQNVRISHTRFNNIIQSYGLPPQGYIVEDQLKAGSNLFVLSANALYRYQGIKDITPFVGAGPALYILKIRGTGYSGIIVDPVGGGSGDNGPRLNQTSINLGLNAKVGFEYEVTKSVGLGLEYHYNWAPIKVDNFRSISNASGNFSSHTIGVFLAKHF